MKLMKLQHCHRSVVLGITQNSTEMHSVPAHALGFGGGKCFDAILESGGRLGVARSRRTRRGAGELVDLVQILPRAFEPFEQPQAGAGRWRRVRRGQGQLLPANQSQEMFGAGRIH